MSILKQINTIPATAHQWRSYFLAIIAISTNLAGVFIFMNPAAGNRSVANFEFPQQIKLSSGKATISPDNFTNVPQLTSEKQQKMEVETEIVEAKQTYRYITNKSPISLEISYLSNTRGSVDSYLRNYTKISVETLKNQKVSQIESIGHHILFSDRDRAYLSSCISPRSLSNVNQKQFSEFRYQNDLTPQVAWQWLQGKASIRDRRCLWVRLSTPSMASSQAAYETLESTWKEIYQWWLPNFPAL